MKKTLFNHASQSPAGAIDPEAFYGRPLHDLTIACIISDDLWKTLEADARVLLLTPGNCMRVIKYVPVDFLLVEPCALPGDGDWGHALLCEGGLNDRVHDLIRLCNRKNVPTVCWKTNNAYGSPALDALLAKFDHLFTTDADESALCSRKAAYLPEAIQPRRHNPFIRLGEARTRQCIIEDDPLPAVETLGMDALERYDVHFFDTHFRRLDKAVKGLDPLIAARMHGHADRDQLADVIKKAAAYVSLEESYNSPSCRRALALEAAAVGTPVLHLGPLGDNDLRRGFVIQCANEFALREELARLQDPLYRLRTGQRQFREVHDRHTIAHRLQAICDALQIDRKWSEYPLATMACGTHRIDRILAACDSFERQNYPNRELIIVYNGDETVPQETADAVHAGKNRCLLSVPRELALGGALNCALDAASGEYFFKIDDDDHYGENYIRDMVLAVRSLNIDVWGKPQVNFFRFEGEDVVYQRKNSRGHFYLAQSSWPQVNGKQVIIGNSVAARIDVLKKHPFTPGLKRHTDSAFFHSLADTQLNMAVCDPFNMVVERRSDLSSHTWAASREQLLETCENRYSIPETLV